MWLRVFNIVYEDGGEAASQADADVEEEEGEEAEELPGEGLLPLHAPQQAAVCTCKTRVILRMKPVLISVVSVQALQQHRSHRRPPARGQVLIVCHSMT